MMSVISAQSTARKLPARDADEDRPDDEDAAAPARAPRSSCPSAPSAQAA